MNSTQVVHKEDEVYSFMFVSRGHNQWELNANLLHIH